MKPKQLLFASICLNLILAGWVMLLLGTRTGQPTGAPTATASPESAASSAQPRGAVKAAPRPAEASRVAPFDWRQVESADYKQYIANLRAIGCPEKTIKNIIVADVNDLFSSRMASVTQTNQYQYWKKEPVSRSEEQRKQLRDLYTQKQDLLKVLGVDTPDFSDLLGEAYRDGMEERDLQLAFLPAFKWQQTKEALFQQAQQEVAEDNSVERSGAIEQQTQARIDRKSVV